MLEYITVGRVGASKLDESAAHRSLKKVLRIETWRKCCASRLDESAAYWGFTKVLRILCQPRTDNFARNELGQNLHSPKRRVFVFFFFTQLSLITDGPYSTVGCRRTICRRTARLEFHLKNKNDPRLEKWVKNGFTTRKQSLLWRRLLRRHCWLRNDATSTVCNMSAAFPAWHAVLYTYRTVHTYRVCTTS